MTSTFARDTRVCAFCETEINTDDTVKDGNKSICDNCSRRYKIKTYNFGEEGCGCDG